MLDSIGEGAYARVNKGVHIASNTPVAIKFMKQPCQSIDQVRLLPEVIALCKLQSTNKCRNIISLKSVIVEDNRAALVLEHMPCDLLTLMRTSPRGFSEPVVVAIIRQLLNAVAHCHLHGIIHRDIKLENILIDAPGLVQWLHDRSPDSITAAAHFLDSLSDLSAIRVVLADFGESRSVRTCRGSDAHAGTLWSRAPEQLLHQTYSSPVDVWSVGCIAAELISGCSLFAADNEAGVLSRISQVLGCSIFVPVPSSHLRHFESQAESTCSTVNCDRLRWSLPRSSLSSCKFLARLLDVNMYTRAKASEALSHQFLQKLQPNITHIAVRPSTARPRIESVTMHLSAIAAAPPISSITMPVVIAPAVSLRPTTAFSMLPNTNRPTTAYSVSRDACRNRTRLTTAASILR